jgi:hypothetical protein
MKTSYKAVAATFSGLALALLFIPNSTAQCGRYPRQGIAPANWHLQSGPAHSGQARLLQTAYVTTEDENAREERFSGEAAIVGMWHFKFVSIGTTGIPDNTEVDAGYAQWHSDHTEITNSGGRAPLTGSFCLGIWKQVGERKYKLNHFAVGWDATGEHFIGPGHIREDVTLSPDGNRFAGTFTVDQYDESGNLLAHLQGTITGTRITADTPPSSIF